METPGAVGPIRNIFMTTPIVLVLDSSRVTGKPSHTGHDPTSRVFLNFRLHGNDIAGVFTAGVVA